MIKKSLFLSAVVLGVLSMPVQAKTTSVDEIQNLSNPVAAVASRKDALSSDSYAYRSLKSLYGKFGGVMDLPQDKFVGTKPLTRNEAALILVNILGKVQKDKIQLTDLDKERIEALNDQLKEEISMLTARVAKVETSVDALQENVGTLEGRITNLEDSSLHTPTFNYGKSLKVGGMFRGEFSTISQGGTNSNFEVPISQISLSGQPMEHANYFVLLSPYYAKVGGYPFADAKQIVDRAYVQTDIIPHHKLTFGKQVVPILDISSKFYSEMDTVDYFPQIGPLGFDRQSGIKLAGSYKYLNYQAGAFARNVADSDNAGLAYVARAGIKPLANVPQYGNLELGGSYYVSDKNTPWGDLSLVPSSYYSLLNDRAVSIYTIFGKYKYNDFEIVSEFMQQNNCLDVNTLSINPFDPLLSKLGFPKQTVARNTDVTGWYTQASYYITPKIQLVGRFDTRKNDIGSYGMGNQYLAGINYYFKYPNLRLLADYIVQDYKGLKTANKFVIQTQFLF